MVTTFFRRNNTKRTGILKILIIEISTAECHCMFSVYQENLKSLPFNSLGQTLMFNVHFHDFNQRHAVPRTLTGLINISLHSL